MTATDHTDAIAAIDALPLHEVIVRLKVLATTPGSALTERDRDFANSLCNSYRKYGSLTVGQRPWAYKLLHKSVPRPATVYHAFDRIVAEFDALFEKGAKRPQLFFRVEGTNSNGTAFKKIGRIKPASRYPQVLYIYIDNVGYVGKIRRDDAGSLKRGEFYPAPGFDLHLPNHHKALLGELTVLDQDPHAYAARFAETGRCCYCNKELTDEASVKHGYGRTCAKTWGRLWNGKPIASKAKGDVTTPGDRVTGDKLPGDSGSNFW